MRGGESLMLISEGKNRYIEKFSDSVNNIVEYLLIVITGVAAISVILGVFNRFIFRFTFLSWTNELSQYLLIWMSMLGASVVTKRGVHVSITFILNKLRKKYQYWVTIVNIIVVMIFLGYVIIYGFKLTISQIGQLSPMMGISMGLVYLSVPVGSLIMIIHFIAKLKLTFSNFS
jgi:TRAP-type C4-dicarboxylate transport system permease small subunit